MTSTKLAARGRPVGDSSMLQESFIIGIIGLGDMGKMYARRLSDAGWR